jgi:hypothetical protein
MSALVTRWCCTAASHTNLVVDYILYIPTPKNLSIFLFEPELRLDPDLGFIMNLEYSQLQNKSLRTPAACPFRVLSVCPYTLEIPTIFR